jgi:hypothetical protein
MLTVISRQTLRDVFQRIRGANLTIKPSKCHLGGREVSVVGHIVGKGQIKVQPDKVRAVKEYPRPRSKKDVRSFLDNNAIVVLSI